MKASIKFYLSLLAFTFIGATVITSCDDDDIPKRTDSKVVLFKIEGKTAAVNHEAGTITATLPQSVDLTSLKPSIVISDKAKISPDTASFQNFTLPVEYIVTAESGHTKTYIATITVGDGVVSAEKQITSFTINSLSAEINEADGIILLSLPFGANITQLTPVITISNKAAVNPGSGIEQDFTNDKTYTVTAQNGSTKTYIVKVTVMEEIAKSSENKILVFTVAGKTATVDHEAGTITCAVSTATDVTQLTPVITVSDNATVSPLSGVEQNFTNPVEYIVTAENETPKTYTVTITVE